MGCRTERILHATCDITGCTSKGTFNRALPNGWEFVTMQRATREQGMRNPPTVLALVCPLCREKVISLFDPYVLEAKLDPEVRNPPHEPAPVAKD